MVLVGIVKMSRIAVFGVDNNALLHIIAEAQRTCDLNGIVLGAIVPVP